MGKAYSKTEPFINRCPKCGKFGFQHDARASDKKRDIYTCLWHNCNYTKAVPVNHRQLSDSDRVEVVKYLEKAKMLNVDVSDDDKIQVLIEKVRVK